MKEIVVDPFTVDEEINIGYQFDHKATKIIFSGLEDNNYYLKLQDTQSYQAFPIPNNEFEITNTYTQKTLITGQIYRKIDNELIAHGKIFKMSLKTSIPQSNKIKEIVPPAFKNEYDRMVDTTNEINRKLTAGEFNGKDGKDGKDYEHSEEFEKLSKDIEKNALNSANSASSALTNANKAKEYLDSVVNKTNTFNSNYTNKVNNFNEDYNSKVDAFNSNVEDANIALNTKISTANTNIDKKVLDANTSLNTKISEANNTIDAKVTEATTQAEKAKNEADRAVLAMDAKLDKNQGAENAGKTMVVDADGNIVPGSALPDNVYTQEEVDSLLQDKMDIPYSDITITQDVNVPFTTNSTFKILDSIAGEATVKTVGKNLFNFDYASNLNNWTLNVNGWDILPIRVPKGYILVTSGDKAGPMNRYYAYFSKKADGSADVSLNNYLYNNSTGAIYGTFTGPVDNIVYLNVTKNQTSVFLKSFKNLQLEVGRVATDYQPYMESLELKTFSTCTNVLVDGETTINCTYPKDILAVVEALEKKVLNLQEATIKNV